MLQLVAVFTNRVTVQHDKTHPHRHAVADTPKMGAEQDLQKIDGMEGSRSAGAKMASVRMDKPGAFEWKRSLLLVSI